MVKRMYSDILGDILKKKYSKCICPTEYLSDLSYRRPSTGGTCYFGPDCQLTPNCAFDQARCTCLGWCECGPQARSLPPTARPELTLTPQCDQARCTCTVCLCRPDDSSPHLLPSVFRGAVKRAATTVTEEQVGRECEEIKQLLEEHQKSQRKNQLESSKKSGKLQDSLEKHDVVLKTTENTPDYSKRTSFSPFSQSAPQQSTDGSRKSLLKSKTNSRDTKKDKRSTRKKNSEESIKKDGAVPSRQLSLAESEHRKKSSSPLNDKIQNQLLVEEQEKSKRNQTTKKDKLTKKEKKAKKKFSIPPSTARTKYMASYCGCITAVRKPVRLRYYYSGGVEHWGVKLGHRACLSSPPLVPKHMGWLWNIEDPTKGIRERKGWPPGFIGKNIKNMMKVMKRAEEVEAAAGLVGAAGAQEGPQSAWRPVEMVEEVQTPRNDPPLLHLTKKGRVCNITFCPKESDEDIPPVPIPFSITEKKKDSGTESSESTLELELHAPQPRGPPKLVRKVATTLKPQAPHTRAPTQDQKTKRPARKARSKGSEENKILWEEQRTQMQNIS